jgi:endonuclease YncB( thermonuclease family)
MKPIYQYAAEVTKIVDGDTFYFKIDVGFGWTHGNDKMPAKVRLADYDTRELSDDDDEKRAKALEAKKYVEKALLNPDGTSKNLIVITRKTKSGKEYQTFGRWVAEVFYQDSFGTWLNLGKTLFEEGLARKP